MATASAGPPAPFFMPWEPTPAFAYAPADSSLAERIQLLVKYAMTNGPSFIDMMKQKQRGDPKFSFLEGGEGADYFRWHLYCSAYQLSGDRPLPAGVPPPHAGTPTPGAPAAHLQPPPAMPPPQPYPQYPYGAPPPHMPYAAPAGHAPAPYPGYPPQHPVHPPHPMAQPPMHPPPQQPPPQQPAMAAAPPTQPQNAVPAPPSGPGIGQAPGQASAGPGEGSGAGGPGPGGGAQPGAARPTFGLPPDVAAGFASVLDNLTSSKVGRTSLGGQAAAGVGRGLSEHREHAGGSVSKWRDWRGAVHALEYRGPGSLAALVGGNATGRTSLTAPGGVGSSIMALGARRASPVTCHVPTRHVHVCAPLQESIKSSSAWLVAQAAAGHAAGLAAAAAHRAVVELGPGPGADYERRLHLIYLANDVLFKGWVAMRSSGLGIYYLDTDRISAQRVGGE